MKKIVIVILIFCLSGFTCLSAENDLSGSELFPELSGWEKGGEPETYSPDNLYEYINGAAEVYLSYNFQKLITLTYSNPREQSITVDIYRHSSSNNGFGIYSQEKPEKGEFLKIGTQGYYEQGILNFYKDRFYIKLSAFDLKEKDRSLLEKMARQIDKKLPGEPVPPKTVSCFPEKGKINNSERFILQNFLGHSFLHSAFVADYQVNGDKIQIFIIEAKSSETADNILNGYFEFLKKKSVGFKEDDNGIIRFTDPYYRSSGPMNLKKKSRFIWGFFNSNADLSHSYIIEIEKNLFGPS